MFIRNELRIMFIFLTDFYSLYYDFIQINISILYLPKNKLMEKGIQNLKFLFMNTWKENALDYYS